MVVTKPPRPAKIISSGLPIAPLRASCRRVSTAQEQVNQIEQVDQKEGCSIREDCWSRQKSKIRRQSKKFQMHGKTCKYEGMRRTYRYAGLPALGQGAPWPTRVSARAGSQAMIHPVKYNYVLFQLFSCLPMPHIQSCNWIKNNLTGQGCSATQQMDFLRSRQN